jgi:hypothetical protein
LNYIVLATDTGLILVRRWLLGKQMIEISSENIRLLEILSSSIMPPLVILALLIASAIGIWGLIGFWSFPPEIPYPFSIIEESMVGLAVLCVLVAIWRVLFATMRIGLLTDKKEITVNFVRKKKAEALARYFI